MSLLAATLTLMAGCSADDDGGRTDIAGPRTPVLLKAEVNASTTRGGVTGNIDYTVLTKEGNAFGVFAYGVNGGDWINKEVTYTLDDNDALGSVHMHTGSWKYAGDTLIWDNQIISFLAYAPYVYVDDQSPLSSPGITNVSGTNVKNTKITYTIATDPTESVDLLWGVREEANKDGEKRLPWLNTAIKDTTGVLNVTKGGGVTFTFHHALTAIGFHVQAMIDKDNDLGDYEDESNVDGILDKYKITLENITLKGKKNEENDFEDKVFRKQATLNLNNTKPGKPSWDDVNNGWVESLTVGNSNINAEFRHGSESAKGVSQQAEQLVITPNSEGAEQCFFVIPNENKQDYTLVLEWYVNDEFHKNEIEIKDWALNPETKYYINLVIGLKSVRLNVTATDWENKPVNIDDIFEHGTSANESLARPSR